MAKKPLPRKSLNDLKSIGRDSGKSQEIRDHESASKLDRSKALNIFSEAEKKKLPRKFGYTFTLSPDVHEALEEAAEINRKTKSALLEKIIQNALM